MARIELSRAAVDDLERLMLTHTLPADTRERSRRSVQPLERFPLLGAALEGRWEGMRFVLGPWRWLLIVYAHLDEDDRVLVVTIQDGRSIRGARST